MITGHVGIAGAVRSLSRARVSGAMLVALTLASVTPDIVDLLYFVANFCSPYGLYSHTIQAVVLEAAVVGGVAFLVSGSRTTAAMFVTVVVLHVPADYLTGQKLFVAGGELVGLHLYVRPAADFLLEAPILLAGWWLMRRGGNAPPWTVSLWMIGLLLVIQTGFDTFAAVYDAGVKPNACTEAPPVNRQT